MSRVAMAGRAIALVALAFQPGGLRAGEVDSEHLFGFTEGSDINREGDRELELATQAGLGARIGRYRAVDSALEGKFTLTDDFRISPGIDFAYRHSHGQQAPGGRGYPDGTHAAFEGLHLELKYRALDRRMAPVGLTFGATPAWGRHDDDGTRAQGWGLGLVAIVDKELVPDRWFAAANLRYGGGTVRSRGAADWQRDSELSAAVAVAGRITGRTWLGGEVRYARAHDGWGLGDFAGHALYVGPALNVHLTDSLWLLAAWNIQVAGRAEGDSRHLDLVNHERHQVTVKLGHPF